MQFPLFSSIGEIILTIKKEVASGIIITPCWVTQIWYLVAVALLK